MNTDEAQPLNADDVVTLTAQLINIPSVSGEEGRVTDEIEATLRGHGHLEVFRDDDAVVTRMNLGKPARILLARHTNTVPVVGNVPGRLEGGVLWGRGSVDMKGGDAVLLHLAMALREPRTGVIWVFYDHEKVEISLGDLSHLSRNRPDWPTADPAVLIEPASSGIEGGCNGTLRVKVKASGVVAHSARPWTGENAMYELLDALASLADWQSEVRKVGGLEYRESLLAAGVSRESGCDSVSDEAHAVVSFRYVSDRTKGGAQAYVRSALSGHDTEVLDSAPSAAPGMDHPELMRPAELLREAGAGESMAKLGWADVARFSAPGISATDCGSGDPPLAHKDDEACPVERIECLARMLRRWLQTQPWPMTDDRFHCQGPMILREARIPGVTANTVLLNNERSSDWTHTDPWHVMRIQSEFVEGFDALVDLPPLISIFGSVRARPGGPSYETAREAARRLAAAGFGAITNEGSGITEAGNKGAREGNGLSVGLRIELPSEQGMNEYVDLGVSSRYFFARETMLLKCSLGFVVMPDGFDTLDRPFEVVTLVQTKKVSLFLIVLVGCNHWGGFDHWIRSTLRESGMAGEVDADLLIVVDMVEEAVDAVRSRIHRLVAEKKTETPE